jgi:uncharacterized protein YcaQ
MVARVTLGALRRFVVVHQGYGSRARRGTKADIATTVRRLQAVQLDSISTVERAHRLTLGARIGAYPAGAESPLLAAGILFEYWAHEACLLHADDYPLMKRRMLELKDRHWWGRPRQEHELEKQVIARIAEEGPLTSRDFEGQRPPEDHPMWNWKPAKRALEHLFAAGEVTVRGRVNGFQRLYDLPERVIPKPLLEAPTPTEEEFVAAYARRAVESRGALTAAAARACGRPSTGCALTGRSSGSRSTTGAPTSTRPPAPRSTERQARRSSSARSTACSGIARS